MTATLRFTLMLLVVVMLAGLTPSARACAACAGQSDDLMAQGMNWGIFALLGVVTCVLGGIAAFFIQVARRSSALAAATAGDAAAIVHSNAPALSHEHHHGTQWHGTVALPARRRHDETGRPLPGASGRNSRDSIRPRFG